MDGCRRKRGKKRKLFALSSLFFFGLTQSIKKREKKKNGER
jgi:hypothetical protein